MMADTSTTVTLARPRIRSVPLTALVATPVMRRYSRVSPIRRRMKALIDFLGAGRGPYAAARAGRSPR